MKRRLFGLSVLVVLCCINCGGGIGGCSGSAQNAGGSGSGGGDTTGGGGAAGAGGDVTSNGAVTGSGGFTATTGFSQQALTVDGTSRQVNLFAPSGLGSAPALVIAFHGTSGEPNDWTDSDPNSDPQGLEALANTNKFVIAAPRARDWGDGAADWDNHGGNDRYWETRFDANPSRGSDPNANADLVLVKQIIAAAHTAFNVDMKRVYLIGFSNGAFFSELAALALRDQIAAFAEAAGGLVKCSRTDSCTFESSSTSCATISSSAPSSCTSCSDIEKPIAIPTSGRMVPGILGHNHQDDGVSVFYTCALSARLQALGYDSQVVIGNESGHGIPPGFVDAAWAFFSTRSLP